MADSRGNVLRAPLGIGQILQDAQHRWLRPAEICEILKNYKKFQIAHEPAMMPSSGSLYVFDRKVLRHFRKDGHNWRKKRDGKTVEEAHQRLKVGSDVLHCYCAYGEHNKNFQRRSYWMIEQELSHIILVHYWEVKQDLKGNSDMIYAGNLEMVPGKVGIYYSVPPKKDKEQGNLEMVPDKVGSYHSVPPFQTSKDKKQGDSEMVPDKAGSYLSVLPFQTTKDKKQGGMHGVNDGIGGTSVEGLEDSQVLEIISLLDTEVNDVRIVGIHGRDGIGKTALAKIVYNKISLHFDACSFLAEIEDAMQQPGGFQCLQTKLIFDILKREYEVASAFKGVRFLKEILRNVKVLLVLDDVENVSLLKEFVGAKLDWFGSGSRIIVTSKQRSILQGFLDQRLAYTYDVSLMDNNRAFDLFWQYAMGKSYKHQPYVEIANGIVKAAEGLPLLVKVFGSFLHGKGKEEWIKFRDLIQQFQEEYQRILRIIYEELDQKQKQMYLDVACFLPDVDFRVASYMWHDYDRPQDEMEVLCRMSLIKMEENKIGMHSMLRCLARKIIYEDFHDPGARVRFFIPGIAHDTKKRKRGTDHLNTIMAGFEILPSTTFLSLGRANIGGRFADALLNIRWLHWQGCPRDPEAISIDLKNLVILDLSWSKVTESWGGWTGIKMEHLKVLNLTGCADLIVTPSFSCYPNLEMLILEQCSRLVHLDPSINDLQLLVTLNLKLCSELSLLPVEMAGVNALKELLIGGTSIRELPASLGKLVQLQILNATNCFSLVKLPSSVCELKALSVLALDNGKMLELPESIGDLGELRRLSLRDCRELGKVPESIGKLADSLEELDISGTSISKLPDSTKNLQSLKVLKMDSCFVREFPREIGELINLQEVHASWCRSLEGVIPSSISKLLRLRELRLQGTRISNLPSEIQFMSSLQILDLLHCDLLKELPPLPSSLINLHVSQDLKR